MIFTQVDLVTGEILGLETQNLVSAEDNWIPTSVEAYQLMCLNNGQYVVNMAAVAEYAKTLEQINENIPLILPEHLVITRSLQKAKQAKKHKSNIYKNLFIEAGVKFNDEIYPYTLEDRINYMEQFHLGVGTHFFVKNKDKENVILSRKEFEELIKEQIKNIRYYEVYTDELNKFIDTIEDYDELQRINYEYKLPEEYLNRIQEEMNLLDFKNGITNLDFTVDNKDETLEIVKEVDDIEVTNKIIENLKENMEHPENIPSRPTTVPKSVKKNLKKEGKK